MKNLVQLTSLATGLFGLAAPAFAEDVSDMLAEIRGKHNIPALAAAAVQGEELIAIGATGVRQADRPEKVTIDDQWHIGSCTKSMTATLAAMFVEEGKLKWDATIGDVLPSMRSKMRPAWKGVTLEQLLRHRSGAPGDAPRDLWAEAYKARGAPKQQRLDFVRGLLEREPQEPPGTKFIYSNQGYAIAGAMLEHVAGMPWEELMQRRIFAPLGMKGAGFGPPGTATRVDEPRAHVLRDDKLQPIPPGPNADNPAAIGPAGTVHCAIGDLARYAAAHAREGRGPHPLLKPESFAKLHSVGEGEDYAMGWGVTKRGWAGGTTLTHTGSNRLWFAVMWVAPAKDAAFVAATNVAGRDAEKACDEAVASLIGRYLK
jgi:CubicO group peptidase (beta-lactamase class C family)